MKEDDTNQLVQTELKPLLIHGLQGQSAPSTYNLVKMKTLTPKKKKKRNFQVDDDILLIHTRLSLIRVAVAVTRR
jgi:hypothetical protein